ncbi:hypothetical protein Tco_0947427 [Tanacetum coccineum]
MRTITTRALAYDTTLQRLVTRKLDDMIESPRSQPKRTYNEDLECEIVMVKMPKSIAWLDDEPIGDLDTMEDMVDNSSPQCTP